jgi:hypothetical protein
LNVLILNLNLLREEISVIGVILFVQDVHEAALFISIITAIQYAYIAYSVVNKFLNVARYFNG